METLRQDKCKGVKSKRSEIILLQAKESLKEHDASTHNIIKSLINVSSVCDIRKLFIPVHHGAGFYTCMQARRQAVIS